MESILRHIRRVVEETWIFISGSFLAFKNSKNRGLLKKNNALVSKHDNQRVFLFLTGTSIKKIDLRKFSKEFVFGANLIAYHNSFEDLQANYYAIPAPCNPRIARLIDFHLLIISNKLGNNCKLFLHGSTKSWIDNSDRFNKDSIFYTLSDEFVKDSKIPPFCGVDASFKGSFTFSVGACVEMGFKEIYLVGADYAKSPLVVGHFYDGEEEINPYPKEVVNQLQKNHSEIKKFCEQNGVKLFNVVEQGFESPIFDSIDIQEVYSLIQ